MRLDHPQPDDRVGDVIPGILRDGEAGIAVKDLCRKHGFSSYYLWKSKFGGMSVSDAIWTVPRSREFLP